MSASFSSNGNFKSAPVTHCIFHKNKIKSSYLLRPQPRWSTNATIVWNSHYSGDSHAEALIIIYIACHQLLQLLYWAIFIHQIIISLFILLQLVFGVSTFINKIIISWHFRVVEINKSLEIVSNLVQHPWV